MSTPGNKPNLMTRLETLEVQLNRIGMIEQLAINLRRSLTTVVEMMNAFVEEMGGAELAAKIQTRLDDKRLAVRRAEAARSAEILKRLIESGQVEPVDAVGEDSILVCTENSLDGKIKGEQISMALMQFNADIQQELLGKQVGYVLSREGVEALKVDGIYRMRETPPQRLTEEEAKQAEAATPPAEAPAVEAPVAEAPAVETPAAPVEVKDVSELPSADEVATTPAAE